MTQVTCCNSLQQPQPTLTFSFDFRFPSPQVQWSETRREFFTSGDWNNNSHFLHHPRNLFFPNKMYHKQATKKILPYHRLNHMMMWYAMKTCSKSNQIKSNEMKWNQIKSNQIRSNQINIRYHEKHFLNESTIYRVTSSTLWIILR